MSLRLPHRYRIIVCIVTCSLLLGACGGGGSDDDIAELQARIAELEAELPTTQQMTPQTTIKGTFTLTADGFEREHSFESSSGYICRGTDGYDDIHEQTTVVVRDGSGNAVATGPLGPGTAIGQYTCIFTFAVDVPALDFYEIEVSHRGALTYSYGDLEDNDWTVELSLG